MNKLKYLILIPLYPLFLVGLTFSFFVHQVRRQAWLNKS